MQKKFDNSEFSCALEYIREQLASLKLKEKDAIRAELMCEETLLNLLNHADFSKRNTFSVNVDKSFGDVVISFTVPGSEFNFIETLGNFDGGDDISPEAEASIRNLLLRSFGNRITYRNARGGNSIDSVRGDWASWDWYGD